MPKVFVTQEISKINYSSAMDYGEVVFLTSDEYKQLPTDGRINNSIKAEIRKKMSEYIAGEDFILTSGSPVSILYTGMMISGQLAAHKILKWNNQSNHYDICML